MKKLIVLLALTLIPASTNAFTILTNTQDLQRQYIINDDGAVDVELLERIKSDGFVGMHNDFFTKDERITMYETLGGEVMIIDGSFMTGNYERLIEEAGRVDFYMGYNEDWMYNDDNAPRVEARRASVDYDWTRIWLDHGPILSDIQVDWITDRLDNMGLYTYIMTDCRQYRNLSFRNDKDNADHFLEHERSAGIVMEIAVLPKVVKNLNMDKLAIKIIDMGKIFMVMLTNGTNTEETFKSNTLKMLNDLRKTIGVKRLSSSDFVIVVNNYGIAEAENKGIFWPVPWFGEGNTVEATIEMLKDQPEWIGSESYGAVSDGTKIDNTQSNNGTGCFINTLF
jgi:hypothetical protein